MSKQNVNMTKWSLDIYGNEYNLSGVADKHPKLGNNVFVAYTSYLIDANLKDDVLVYETKNTIYHCPLKYMKKDAYKNMSTVFVESYKNYEKNKILDDIIKASIEISFEEKEMSDFANNILRLIEVGSKEIEDMKRTEKERLEGIVKEYPDSVYLEVSNINNGSVLAYNIKDKIGLCEPDVHIGMFQDSVLYMVRQIIDFRYFPDYDSLTTYSWSDNIKQAVIKNMKSFPITFNDEEINPGEIKIFSKNTHKQELISPDCVTGKSILTENE